MELSAMLRCSAFLPKHSLCLRQSTARSSSEIMCYGIQKSYTLLCKSKPLCSVREKYYARSEQTVCLCKSIAHDLVRAISSRTGKASVFWRPCLCCCKCRCSFSSRSFTAKRTPAAASFSREALRCGSLLSFVVPRMRILYFTAVYCCIYNIFI